MGARLAMHTAHQSVLTKPLTRARREVGNSSTPAVTAVSPIPCVYAQRQTQALRQLCVRTEPNTSTPSVVHNGTVSRANVLGVRSVVFCNGEC